MTNQLFPNMAISSGKLKRATIQSLSSVSLGASASPQSDVDIPIRGDMIALGVEITGQTTGTLSGANTISSFIDELAIRDGSNRNIYSKVRGVDLPMLDRFLNVGRSRTVPTVVSGTDKTHNFLIPVNIERKDMVARVQVTLSAFSAMATSGATAGTVSVKLVAYYADSSNANFTQRIKRVSQSLVSGTNRWAPNLPKNTAITGLLFTIGTEANLSSVEFSANGDSELADITVNELSSIDDTRLVSGHVTGQFDLYMSPFQSTTQTILDVVANGTDTINWFFITAD